MQALHILISTYLKKYDQLKNYPKKICAIWAEHPRKYINLK